MESLKPKRNIMKLYLGISEKKLKPMSKKESENHGIINTERLESKIDFLESVNTMLLDEFINK